MPARPSCCVADQHHRRPFRPTTLGPVEYLIYLARSSEKDVGSTSWIPRPAGIYIPACLLNDFSRLSASSYRLSQPCNLPHTPQPSSPPINARLRDEAERRTRCRLCLYAPATAAGSCVQRRVEPRLLLGRAAGYPPPTTLDWGGFLLPSLLGPRGRGEPGSAAARKRGAERSWGPTVRTPSHVAIGLYAEPRQEHGLVVLKGLAKEERQPTSGPPHRSLGPGSGHVTTNGLMSLPVVVLTIPVRAAHSLPGHPVPSPCPPRVRVLLSVARRPAWPLNLHTMTGKPVEAPSAAAPGAGPADRGPGLNSSGSDPPRAEPRDASPRDAEPPDSKSRAVRDATASSVTIETCALRSESQETLHAGIPTRPSSPEPDRQDPSSLASSADLPNHSATSELQVDSTDWTHPVRYAGLRATWE